MNSQHQNEPLGEAEEAGAEGRSPVGGGGEREVGEFFLRKTHHAIWLFPHPAGRTGAHAEELNRFLRTHRILSVQLSQLSRNRERP